MTYAVLNYLDGIEKQAVICPWKQQKGKYDQGLKVQKNACRVNIKSGLTRCLDCQTGKANIRAVEERKRRQEIKNRRSNKDVGGRPRIYTGQMCACGAPAKAKGQCYRCYKKDWKEHIKKLAAAQTQLPL